MKPESKILGRLDALYKSKEITKKANKHGHLRFKGNKEIKTLEWVLDIS